MEEEENINVKSKAKLQSCQKQNQLFKEEIKNTKTLIYTIIDQNNESTNEKSIINLMMNKTEKKRKQAKRTSISLIMFNETDNF